MMLLSQVLYHLSLALQTELNSQILCYLSSTIQTKFLSLNMASQDKKYNVRTQKWRLMMQQGIYKDKQLLKARIRKGIPMAIRSLAWPQIVNLRKFIQQKNKEYKYDQLIKSFSNNIYQITLDIPRTFPEEQDSNVLKKSLNNVLKALSIVYPKIGYCQGMNFSALRLLQILDDQVAFWLLNYVYEHDSSIMRNFVDPKSVQRQNYIFSSLMKQKLPKFYDLFQSKNVMYQAYTIKWFMTLYSGSVTQQVFYRIFEVFLNEGWSIIFAVGMALFKNNEKQIFERMTEQILYLFSSQIYQIKNIDEFMDLAYSFDITPQKVRQFGAQYDQRIIQNLKSSSRIRCQKQIQNRQKSNKKIRQIIPQSEKIGVISFQSKAQEVNFQIFQSVFGKKQ